MSCYDALRVVGQPAVKDDQRYSKAAARWLAKVVSEQQLGPAGSREVLSLIEVMPKAPEAIEGALRRCCR